MRGVSRETLVPVRLRRLTAAGYPEALTVTSPAMRAQCPRSGPPRRSDLRPTSRRRICFLAQPGACRPSAGNGRRRARGLGGPPYPRRAVRWVDPPQRRPEPRTPRPSSPMRSSAGALPEAILPSFAPSGESVAHQPTEEARPGKLRKAAHQPPAQRRYDTCPYARGRRGAAQPLPEDSEPR